MILSLEQLQGYKNADRIEPEHTHVAIHRDRPVIVAMGKSYSQCSVHAGIWLCNSTESPRRSGSTYVDPFVIVGIQGRPGVCHPLDFVAIALALFSLPLVILFYLLFRWFK